jgi:hypothetical protein
MRFFGKNVSDTGCEILVKVGTRYNDPNSDGFYKSWRDGQIIHVMPMGFSTEKYIGYCLLLINLPHVNYLDIGGRTQEGWNIRPGRATLWDKISSATNSDGKYKWDLITGTEHSKTRQTRDYFIDVEKLRIAGSLTLADKERVYNHDIKSVITLPAVLNIEEILCHEEVDIRKDQLMLLRHASITTGVYSIGAGLDYATVITFEAAIGAALTGNLTGEHADEETAFGTDTTFDTDTATYLLKLTAASGAEHSGIYDGARILFGTFNDLIFNETTGGHLADVEVSNIAFDVSGEANIALYFADCSDAGMVTANRNLIKGAATTRRGIFIDYETPNATITNNIIYGIQDATQGQGIEFYWTTGALNIMNNTVKACRQGIHSDAGSSGAGQVIKNNLVQECTSVDYLTDASWPSGTAKNLSSDATSPDAAYQSIDLHTNTIFVNYATDSLRLDSAGDATNLAIVDDGDDLSGTFTDDIIGQTRSTWYIGASEIVAAAGGPHLGSLNLTGVGR